MKIRLGILILTVLCSYGAQARDRIEGITLPPHVISNGEELALNGGGVRTKFFLKVYVTGLYLLDKASDALEIINSDKPMSIQLHITSDLVSSGQMISSIEEGLEKSTNGKQEKFRQEIDTLTSAFSKEFSKGDIFDIAYAPQSGVEVFKNGVDQTYVGDLEFKKALWGIWLSEKPVDQKLKQGMLGL